MDKEYDYQLLGLSYSSPRCVMCLICQQSFTLQRLVPCRKLVPGRGLPDLEERQLPRLRLPRLALEPELAAVA